MYECVHSPITFTPLFVKTVKLTFSLFVSKLIYSDVSLYCMMVYHQLVSRTLRMLGAI